MKPEKKIKKVRIVIELKEYSVPKEMNDKLIEYQNAGEYKAFNELLDYIQDNYKSTRHIPNIYFRQ